MVVEISWGIVFDTGPIVLFVFLNNVGKGGTAPVGTANNIFCGIVVIAFVGLGLDDGIPIWLDMLEYRKVPCTTCFK